MPYTAIDLCQAAHKVVQRHILVHPQDTPAALPEVHYLTFWFWVQRVLFVGGMAATPRSPARWKIFFWDPPSPQTSRSRDPLGTYVGSRSSASHLRSDYCWNYCHPIGACWYQSILLLVNPALSDGTVAFFQHCYSLLRGPNSNSLNVSSRSLPLRPCWCELWSEAGGVVAFTPSVGCSV